jgi:hypothetical protein
VVQSLFSNQPSGPVDSGLFKVAQSTPALPHARVPLGLSVVGFLLVPFSPARWPLGRSTLRPTIRSLPFPTVVAGCQSCPHLLLRLPARRLHYLCITWTLILPTANRSALPAPSVNDYVSRSAPSTVLKPIHSPLPPCPSFFFLPVISLHSIDDIVSPRRILRKHS